jgi:histidinol-phosphatase (PHP family)
MTASPLPGNFHTHTHHCDGSGTPSEFVDAALRKGMRRLGFSGHNVLPFPTTWTMPAERLESYLRDVREARQVPVDGSRSSWASRPTTFRA